MTERDLGIKKLFGVHMGGRDGKMVLEEREQEGRWVLGRGGGTASRRRRCPWCCSPALPCGVTVTAFASPLSPPLAHESGVELGDLCV